MTWRKLAVDLAKAIIYFLKNKDYEDRYKLTQMGLDILAKDQEDGQAKTN